MRIVRGAALLLLLVAACATGIAAEPTNLFRVYYIGNSVTDTVRYGELTTLAATRGVKVIWGRQMIPGAPLEWLYTHPNDGFQEEPYGTWPRALGEFAWDAVSLQPFDRHLHGNNDKGEDMGDVALITKLAALAAKQNPDVQVYIYARWPRMTTDGKGVQFDKNDYDPAKPGSGADFSKVDGFAARWGARYTGGWDLTNEGRDYFDQLLAEVRKETPFLKKRVLLVPVGHVMVAMDEQMKAGQVPGYTSIYQFYKDGIHLNEPGSYLVGCTFFATLLRQSPEASPPNPTARSQQPWQRRFRRRRGRLSARILMPGSPSPKTLAHENTCCCPPGLPPPGIVGSRCARNRRHPERPLESTDNRLAEEPQSCDR